MRITYIVLNGERSDMRIDVYRAFLDLLKEYGITVEDLLAAMRSEGIDVYGEIIKRISYSSPFIKKTIYSLPWRKAAILLFIIQTFYIVNISGIYKGYLIDPPRELVMDGLKVKPSGVILLIKKLNQAM